MHNESFLETSQVAKQRSCETGLNHLCLNRQTPKMHGCHFFAGRGVSNTLHPSWSASCPRISNGSTYHEPFLGAATIFFRTRPRAARLADANTSLVNTYRWIRDAWQKVADHLSVHSANASEQYYYEIRKAFNAGKPSASQAARFIFLNRTCFNGIFRVNTSGKFNVPYGFKEPPPMPSPEDLKAASDLLHKAELEAEPFLVSLSKLAPGDFVYLDPPYPPLNGTAYFTHYTYNRFSRAQQIQLAASVYRLHRLGCRILMTNADLPMVRSLYKDFAIIRLTVTRFITCKKERHSVTELVIKNY